MTVLQAMTFLETLIKLSATVLGNIKRVSSIIRTAQTENRDLTEQEIEAIKRIDDTARKVLVEAIENTEES